MKKGEVKGGRWLSPKEAQPRLDALLKRGLAKNRETPLLEGKLKAALKVDYQDGRFLFQASAGLALGLG